jgi:hypothetical protein
MEAWETIYFASTILRSDERFRDRKTVYAASVAYDCSGNERGVNVPKRSGLIKRGFHQRMNPIRFNCVWRCWAFCAKLMLNQSYDFKLAKILAKINMCVTPA